MTMWVLIIVTVALLVGAGIWIDHRRGKSSDYPGHQATAKKGTTTDSMPDLQGPSL